MFKKDSFLVGIMVFALALGIFVLRSDHVDQSAIPSQEARVSSFDNDLYQKVVHEKERGEALKLIVQNKYDNYEEKTITGRIEVVYDENGKFNENQNPMKHFLVSSDKIYQIKNLGSSLPSAIDGAKVEITGFINPGRSPNDFIIYLESEDLNNIRVKRFVPKKSNLNREEDIPECVEGFCALVVPVDFNNQTSNLPNSSDIQEYIATRIKSAISEESYGSVIYNTVVLPWQTITPQNLSPFYPPYEIEQYFIQNNINISNYDQLVFLINGGAQSYGGEATIGETTYWMNGNAYSIPVALVGFSNYINNQNLTASNGNLSYFDYLYVHETGHNFNALHDNLLTCKNGPVSLPSECVMVEYGNKYSIMGDGSYGGHFSFLNKIRAGWLNTSNITLSSSGSYSLSNIENTPTSFLGTNGNSNSIPEYIFEKRSPVGLDELNLFTNLNLNGSFLYKFLNKNELTADPFTWDIGLIDTTPPSSSQTWYNSMNDVVFKIPQLYADIQNHIRFGQNAGGENNLIGLDSGLTVANPCTYKPVKFFEPYLNQGDSFTGQISLHKWPIKMGQPLISSSLIQNIQADVNDPTSQIFLYKNVIIFNDDYLACGVGNYNFEFIFNNESLPLINEPTESYNPSSGPYFKTVMAYLPTYGLNYGQHTIILKITKLNDGTTFSRNLVFNLVP